MRHQIDNQYHYGVVYNLNGEIAGFNLSPDIHVPLTDDDIEKALEYYIELHCPLENEQGEKMTREEAIEQLENAILLILQDGKDYMDERDIPVLKMAIQALKQQPIIRCKECNFYTEMRTDLKMGICSLACRHMGDDGFCSEAERREETEEGSE